MLTNSTVFLSKFQHPTPEKSSKSGFDAILKKFFRKKKSFLVLQSSKNRIWIIFHGVEAECSTPDIAIWISERSHGLKTHRQPPYSASKFVFLQLRVIFDEFSKIYFPMVLPEKRKKRFWKDFLGCGVEFEASR